MMQKRISYMSKKLLRRGIKSLQSKDLGFRKKGTVSCAGQHMNKERSDFKTFRRRTTLVLPAKLWIIILTE